MDRLFLFYDDMEKKSFDEYANEYDRWFMNNEGVLYSEVLLVAKVMQNAGHTLSVGCGSGLFEQTLRNEFGINITRGIEPSAGMAGIARVRGMEVVIGTAEEADFGTEQYDTVMFNGTPSYITDLRLAFEKAWNALKPGGRIVVIDVPKESGYATLYNLAKCVDTWEHPLLEGVKPRDPYPLEFVKMANWRTTQEKIDLLTAQGFENMTFAQTLTRHPLYSDQDAEQPIDGYDRGDYVAIVAHKKA